MHFFVGLEAPVVGREPWVLRGAAPSWPAAMEPKEASRPVTATERPESAPLGGVLWPARPRKSSTVADGAGESCSGGTLNGWPALFRNGLLGPFVWLLASPAQAMTPVKCLFRSAWHAHGHKHTYLHIEACL